jgi:hypothetical protein
MKCIFYRQVFEIEKITFYFFFSFSFFLIFILLFFFFFFSFSFSFIDIFFTITGSVELLIKGRVIEQYFAQNDEDPSTDEPDTTPRSGTNETFFGEEALLGLSHRRATVRCVSFCDFFVLSRADFEIVLCDFPRFRDVVRSHSIERAWARLSKGINES